MLTQYRMDKLGFDRVFQYYDSDKSLVVELEHFELKIIQKLEVSMFKK